MNDFTSDDTEYNWMNITDVQKTMMYDRLAEDLRKVVENVIDTHTPIRVIHPYGNVVIMSEQALDGITEVLEILQDPARLCQILVAMRTVA